MERVINMRMNLNHAYAAGEKYFPDEIDPVEFYKPTDRGLEKKIKEKLDYLDSFHERLKIKIRVNYD